MGSKAISGAKHLRRDLLSVVCISTVTFLSVRQQLGRVRRTGAVGAFNLRAAAAAHASLDEASEHTERGHL